MFNRTCLINYDCYRHYFPVFRSAEPRQVKGFAQLVSDPPYQP